MYRLFIHATPILTMRFCSWPAVRVLTACFVLRLMSRTVSGTAWGADFHALNGFTALVPARADQC